ncbi:MAG: Type I Iterative PKS [Bathelium mastoideum]|nr:MAG: Type I Iterative PKS [Bathelium mastoideum]
MATAILGESSRMAEDWKRAHQTKSQDFTTHEPIAIVGLACRLPGNNNSPTNLWDFLRKGEQAKIDPPPSRFNPAGHYNGSSNGRSMVMPGGMFLEDIDIRDIDSKFFKLSNHEALCMDPQQRQLLEVVYEGLENAGIPLERLKGEPYGCFVGSYACDYGDAQNRDPEERVSAYAVGVGRAMLSNRISHFLDIKGPSMTIDTACSGSLISLATACQYLQSQNVAGAIVGACNLYLSPEHAMDMFAISGAGSPTGRCHTFDAKADGYIKSEAVNMVILRRLQDAIRDKDPIRAVIRGSATNSDGWTAGIASPDADAQAAVIKLAYANAGITDFTQTTYVECHGTGTKAGDRVEAEGLGKVFSTYLPADRPLCIGSIKSNIGHSEPAAGLSGLIKVVLSIQNGAIPGNPTFNNPNPNIDFFNLRLQASKELRVWPSVPFRRAGVSSFGYGGSNVHVVVDEANHALLGGTPTHVSSFVNEDASDLFGETVTTDRQYVLVFSANDEQSLRTYSESLDRHLSYPGVNVQLKDLAYTLSERRTHHFHRAYLITNECTIDRNALVLGKICSNPRIGLIFTGQGGQWPQMGLALCENFPIARKVIHSLDETLRKLPDGPIWSAYDELTLPRSKSHMQSPEMSQTLVTILQIAILTLLQSWGIEWCAVAGHSSGEIACAVAAGKLSPEDAVKIAYYRGYLAQSLVAKNTSTGMLAVGLGHDQVGQYISNFPAVEVACSNSPSSCTLSGELSDLEEVRTRMTRDGHFARVLAVDLAYHSRHVRPAASQYKELLNYHCEFQNNPCVPSGTCMFSSVTGQRMEDQCDASYWTRNMISPVMFSNAVNAMQTDPKSPGILLEIGPSGTLAGPLSQIRQNLPNQAVDFEYFAAFKRGESACSTLFDLAGKLFNSGCSINLSEVHRDPKGNLPRVIVDLPNYAWDHRTKFWKENESSRDWRFRRFIQHDLLGSKVLGTPWTFPVWKKSIGINDVPWLCDHMLGSNIVFPAAGYISMAVEAIFQRSISLNGIDQDKPVNGLTYCLRDVSFSSMLVFSASGSEEKLTLTLHTPSEDHDTWHLFRISSSANGAVTDHCKGQIRIMKNPDRDACTPNLQPLRNPLHASFWYKAMRVVGYAFGPAFRKQLEIESQAGWRTNRAYLSLLPSRTAQVESSYPLHPTILDSCLQCGAASLWQGLQTSVDALLVPSHIDTITIAAQSAGPAHGTSISSAEYIGFGSKAEAQNYYTTTRVYNSEDGSLLLKVEGLHYTKLETRDSIYNSPTYARVEWKPDLSLAYKEYPGRIIVDETPMFGLEDHGPNDMHPMQKMMDLIYHKSHYPSIIEINLLGNANSRWLDACGLQTPSFRGYHLILASHESVLNAQDLYCNNRGAALSIGEYTDFIRSSSQRDVACDVVIISTGPHPIRSSQTALQELSTILGKDGTLLLIAHSSPHSASMPKQNESTLCRSLRTPQGLIDEALQPSSLAFQFYENEEIISVCISHTAVLGTSSRSTTQDVHFAHFCAPAEASSQVIDQINCLGRHSLHHWLPFHSIPHQSTVVVLTELDSPVLARMTSEQWDGLKALVSLGCRILWITTGGQMDVSNPDGAMASGLMRTLRNENPGQVIVTLDVDPSASNNLVKSICHLIDRLNGSSPMDEFEFVNRAGVLYIPRIKQHPALNDIQTSLILGTEPRSIPFHQHPRCIRLRNARVGTLDSLHYAEIATYEIPLEQEFAEIELHAASLNFKDVATVMGLVPADASLIGLDGAGTIRRLHSTYTGPLYVGQRVLVTRKGCFSNLVQAPVNGLYPLPEWMTFEDASTIPSVYRVCVYGLLDLADLPRAKTILIHSGAGGVGIAAIQICQHYGTEIYVTVGSEHKRKFLMETYGIPNDHIFSSRTTEFASQLMSATHGRGVDIVLNSLSGDLLDASWHCIAQDGNFIEIGKKDLVNNGSLSMSPFCRNASYRAIDMSFDNIPWPETQK